MTPARQSARDIAHAHCEGNCVGGEPDGMGGVWLHSRHCDELTKAIEDYAGRKGDDRT